MKTVTAAIAIKDQHIFLARRAKNQKLAGYWEFPGGKVEPNETLQECLVRELHEEFSVSSVANSIICQSIYHYDHGSIRLVGIEIEFESTNFQMLVHDRIEWVALDQLLQMKLAPADIPIAQYIMESYR